MEAALQREAEQLFGPDVHLRAGRPLPLVPPRSPSGFGDPTAVDLPPGPSVPAAASPKRSLTDEEWRQLWAQVGEVDGFWSALDEIEPGAVARLGSLTALHRWEVIFVTQRPAGAGMTPQLQTQQWLRARGFELPSVFVMHGSRGRLAEALALDVVIDDRPDNCLDVVTDSTAKAVLVWRDEPAMVPAGVKRPGIVVTASFAAALDQLERITALRARPAGFVGRIRNAIGI